MLLKTLLITMTIASAQTPIPRDEAKKKILDGCLAKAKQVIDVRKKVCECIVINFDAKSNDQDMDSLAKNYASTKKDKRTIKEIEKRQIGSTLDSFDEEVATACIADPKWRMKVEADEK